MQNREESVQYIPMFYDGRTPGSMQVWLEQAVYEHDLDDDLSYEDALHLALDLLNESEYMEEWEQKMMAQIASLCPGEGKFCDHLRAIVQHAHR